jgi:hypothetical protein
LFLAAACNKSGKDFPQGKGEDWEDSREGETCTTNTRLSHLPPYKNQPPHTTHLRPPSISIHPLPPFPSQPRRREREREKEKDFISQEKEKGGRGSEDKRLPPLLPAL